MKQEYKIAKGWMIFMPLFIIGYGCKERMNQNPITIEAVFMQYACGDWNDDMKVNKVNDTSFNFLIGKDIDPLFINGENEISGWLYDNKTDKYGMEYRLIGYISKTAKDGCENKTPKFWITHIEKLNGEKFNMPKSE